MVPYSDHSLLASSHRLTLDDVASVMRSVAPGTKTSAADTCSHSTWYQSSHILPTMPPTATTHKHVHVTDNARGMQVTGWKPSASPGCSSCARPGRARGPGPEWVQDRPGRPPPQSCWPPLLGRAATCVQSGCACSPVHPCVAHAVYRCQHART